MNPEFEDDNDLLSESSVEHFKGKFPYMKKIIAASKLINMWPKTKSKNSFIYHLAVWATIINCSSFIFTFLIEIKNEFRNMDSITALIDFVTVFISGTFRYIYIYAKGDKYLYLVSKIHNNFIHCPFFPGSKKTSLEKYYKFANRLILTYGTFTFFWILQISFVPIISYAWAASHLSSGSNQTAPEHFAYPVAMKVYAPFDYSKQPANTLFYMYQFFGFLLFGYIYIVVDSFWYMVIFLTIGQLVLIKDSLNTLAEHLKRNATPQEVQLSEKDKIDKLEAGLKKCIRHHQFIRKFILMIEDINNPNILVDSLHAAISIGFILLDISIALKTRDLNKVIFSLEYLTTSIVHMFFFDWLADKLAEKEEELGEVVYEIPWYQYPSQKFQMMLLMIQSRRPHKLTGGKMYQLSLNFFTSMIRAVFSYFTFLFQLRNNTLQSAK